jgi:hypothetical protein
MPTADKVDPLQIPCRTLTVGTKAWGTTYFWKNKHEFTVKFIDPSPDSMAIEKVKIAVQAWTEAANLKFTYVTSGKADIRISFLGRGHWSNVGTSSQGVGQLHPTMNLQLTGSDRQDEFNRVARHEFGHALGLMHEHQHPKMTIQWNKPVVYAAYAKPPNKWSKNVVDEQVFAVYSGSFEGTEPDPSSIMMYPVLKGWAKDFVVGWNRDLSANDVAFIRKVYP